MGKGQINKKRFDKYFGTIFLFEISIIVYNIVIYYKIPPLLNIPRYALVLLKNSMHIFGFEFQSQVPGYFNKTDKHG